jgi:hypothetical protein
MVGKVSYVVLSAGGENGLQVVRHPTADLHRAFEKAVECAEADPGVAFYVSTVLHKVIVPIRPRAELISLK